MCNACGFACCALDTFEGCGCESCGNPECLEYCDGCFESTTLGYCKCIVYDDDFEEEDDDERGSEVPSARR